MIVVQQSKQTINDCSQMTNIPPGTVVEDTVDWVVVGDVSILFVNITTTNTLNNPTVVYV